MADNTNWGSVAIAGAVVYVAYLLSKREGGLFDFNIGGLGSNTYIEKTASEKYIESKTSQELRNLVQGMPIDDASKEALKYNVYTKDNYFTDDPALIITPPNIDIRDATTDEIKAGAAKVALYGTSPLGAMASGVVTIPQNKVSKSKASTPASRAGIPVGVRITASDPSNAAVNAAWKKISAAKAAAKKK